jgi:hypothetical protein
MLKNPHLDQGFLYKKIYQVALLARIPKKMSVNEGS